MVTHKRVLQDLLQHQGWEQYRDLVLKDKEVGHNKTRKCLRSQIQDKLNSSARSADWEKTAYFTGQLDILETVLKVPEVEYNRA